MNSLAFSCAEIVNVVGERNNAFMKNGMEIVVGNSWITVTFPSLNHKEPIVVTLTQDVSRQVNGIITSS